MIFPDCVAEACDAAGSPATAHLRPPIMSRQPITALESLFDMARPPAG
jgi:hypothetical protein